MEFGIEKCAMLVKKSGKQLVINGIVPPNQEKIRTLGEKETYKYFGILEADTIKQVEMKDKIQKEYLKRTKKLLNKKTIFLKLYQMNKYLGCTPLLYIQDIVEEGWR